MMFGIKEASERLTHCVGVLHFQTVEKKLLHAKLA